MTCFYQLLLVSSILLDSVDYAKISVMFWLIMISSTQASLEIIDLQLPTMEGEMYEVGSIECSHPLCEEIRKHLFYRYSLHLSRMMYLSEDKTTRLEGYYLIAFKKYCYKANLSSYLQDPPFRRKKPSISVTLNQSGKQGMSNSMYASIEEIVQRKLHYMFAEEESLKVAMRQEEEAHHHERMTWIKAKIESYQPIFDQEEAARRAVRRLREEIEDLKDELRVAQAIASKRR